MPSASLEGVRRQESGAGSAVEGQGGRQSPQLEPSEMKQQRECTPGHHPHIPNQELLIEPGADEGVVEGVDAGDHLLVAGSEAPAGQRAAQGCSRLRPHAPAGIAQ